MRAWDLVFDVTETLARAGIHSPAADARWLVSHALGCDASALVLREASLEDQERVAELVTRRLAGEPVQHITGFAPFRYREIAVGTGVFIPRPETELLVDHVLNYLATHELSQAKVVELCAGSGAISASLATERGGLELYAVEKSQSAWEWLQRNLAGLPVVCELGDMATAFPELNGCCDVVVANPPYVPEGLRGKLPAEVSYDPEEALFSGPDGLAAIRVLRQVALRLLKPGGLLALEHDESHASQVVELLRDGFEAVVSKPDLAGRARHCLALRGRIAG